MAKRMVNDAEVVNNLTEYVRQENNKTIIGGNLEVDGNLTVNGAAPGGMHVYKIKAMSNDNSEVYFLWTCTTDNMTTQSMTNELTYKLSSGSGFTMGIPAVKNQIGYYNCIVAYDGGGLKEFTDGTHSNEITINTVYKIY